jgi:hypothetical protein
MASTPLGARSSETLPPSIDRVAQETGGSAVSWAAIIAGAAATAGLSLILLTLGTGLGLAALSPWSNSGASSSAIGAAAIAWLVITQLLASAMGGYLAGRLRTKWTGVHTDEVYFRDTAHGLLSWATSVVVTAALLTGAVASLTGGRTGASGATSPVTAMSTDRSGTDWTEGATGNDYYTDLLFRSDHPAPDRSESAVRAEADRILEASLRAREMSTADRTYLGGLIAARTGLAQAEAEHRATDIFAQVQSALDRGRKAAVSLSLWMFLALLGGAFCASITATIGGRQRDHIRPV